MKFILKFILAIALPALISLGTYAQEGNRGVNPGEDPNEAISTDGQGVAELGCLDPNKACIKNLYHGPIGKNTKPGTGGGAGSSSGTGNTPVKGTR